MRTSTATKPQLRQKRQYRQPLSTHTSKSPPKWQHWQPPSLHANLAPSTKGEGGGKGPKPQSRPKRQYWHSPALTNRISGKNGNRPRLSF